MPSTTRQNAIWVEALEDESGWAWFIPLHDGSTSVRIVMDLESSNHKKKASRAASGGSGSNLLAHYKEELSRVHSKALERRGCPTLAHLKDCHLLHEACGPGRWGDSN
ncbi:uncharacterized protein BJ212DRAFT_1483048 [Suillus subaureus]|uniref:Uncharacterized protein n=1 Tax=Suillus subaureus TaxID=48587 RepID=A0A9P7JBA8_9AGAM|nr:uncharacterized protein BJ212DRAFT_1483048 [Suillus subaureus]KAG1812409.1 hypothetical protein BJ212DRAFT_1483048 [Suillus subaureus]